MTLLTPPATARLHPSRRLTVCLRATGFVVPGYAGQADVPLDLDDLLAIEALLTGVPVDATSPLMQALVERELLVASPDDDLPAAGGGRLELSSAAEGEVGLASALELVLPVPVLLACGPDGFDYVDHDGVSRARLTAVELVAAGGFRRPTTVADALAAHRQQLGPAALDEDHYVDVVRHAVGGGLIVPYDPDDPLHASEAKAAARMGRDLRRVASVHAEFDRLEAEHDEHAGTLGHTRVIGFHTNWASPPSSLGMVLAAARSFEDGRLEQHYDFRPRLMWNRDRLESAAAGPPAIFLFSNYIWSSTENLNHSALVKAGNPSHLTIHGGPDTPRYPDDLARWFGEHPHVDIAVHGEGEATFPEALLALALSGAEGPEALSALADVPGLSYRDGDRVVSTGSRDRIADLNTIPSPALTGLFDGFIPVGGGDSGLILETNRGCPYGCTFCDWGSATLSRVRQFDIERIFAELEWCATHELGIGIADANFGIFERDVEIAEKIAELKATYGYPQFVGNNYAKNTVKHLSKIIDIFTEAGIVAEGKMSMQTFDEGTLTTIRRKNIKVEKYHALSVEFRRNRLPLAVELMMGLPGSTPTTFLNDLQSCINRDVRTAVYPTVLLPNSPMNDPAYRQENGIVALPGEQINQTSTYGPDEFDAMLRLRQAFYVFENFGVLRQVATYVRFETGVREIDFYQQLVLACYAEPERWPTLAITVQVIPEMMVPPVSWRRFIEEVRRYLVEVAGIPDDEALTTILTVQHALIPARGRRFPATLQLAHDVVAWRDAIAACRDDGHYDDWREQCAPLRSFGPGEFTVTDPLDSCGKELGFPAASIRYYDNAWDMSSPVSRPRQAIPDAPAI